MYFFVFLRVLSFFLSFFLSFGCTTFSDKSTQSPSLFKKKPKEGFSNFFGDDEISQLPFSPLLETKKENHPSYKFWLTYFRTKAKRTVPAWVKNISPYRQQVEEILTSHGVPKEFIALSLIESGFNLKARSPKNAVGPWQFRIDTGRHFGLTIDKKIDERKDPYKSTHAAAKCLKELFGIFKDWKLVLAAYNAGQYKVQRVIQKAKTADFWALYQTSHLRQATKDFVPKFFAVVTLINELNESENLRCENSQARECQAQYAK